MLKAAACLGDAPSTQGPQGRGADSRAAYIPCCGGQQALLLFAGQWRRPGWYCVGLCSPSLQSEPGCMSTQLVVLGVGAKIRLRQICGLGGDGMRAVCGVQ